MFAFVAGIYLVPDWKSFLIGAFIMFCMFSVVLNKIKAEVKEMIK